MTRKTQKKLRKLLTLVCCAVMLVCVSVGATIAYLTSQDSVTNTFTVGKLKITLDETKVDVNGVADEDADPVKANEYHLVPNHEYVKDPTVHFAAGNDKSYVFVKVENGIEAIESQDADYVSIEEQIAANNWTALTGVENVYYKVVEANTTDEPVDLPVFGNFKIDDEAVLSVTENGVTTYPYESAQIKITAYAIQFDGFTDTKDEDGNVVTAAVNNAWTAGNFQ